MNIQEAVKSGKKFRRKSWDNKCFYLEVTDSGFIVNECGQDGILKDTDILATDWVVGEEKVEITKEDLISAAEVSCGDVYVDWSDHDRAAFDILCMELGL